MKITVQQGKKHGSRRLMLFVTVIVILLAGRIGTAACKAEINSSGTMNVKLSIDPIRKSEGFSTVLYDNRNGLPTSEANAITQTGEGFIWIGSYSGLIRFDGTTFERIDSTTGISNVRCLFVDSLDRLWIGTNDTGLFLMKNGILRKWDKGDGLHSVSIRAITEDANGSFYIASAAGIARIDQDLNLTMLEDERIDGHTIRDLRRGNDGLIYGLTQAGDLFTLKDGELHFFLSHEECRVEGILSILPDPRHPGDLYLGTEQSQIFYGTLERNFSTLGMKETGSLSSVECFEYINGEIWVCAGNGIGKLDAEGFHTLKNVPMNNSVGHVMTDYEGNLWFTSTRQGIMKIVPNQFSDIFERYGLPTAVVNSTCMLRQQLFIGTDSGLIVVRDRKRVESLPLTRAVTASGTELGATDLLELLEGVRIRSLVPDSQGRLWISTWRKYGLICYCGDEVTAFTQEDGLFSDQIRTVSECADGSILVANRGGVSVIRDGHVTACYGKEDGIVVTDLLTLTEGFSQEMVLGSDGGGIFIVGPDGTRHIGTEDGLKSEIILRIKRDSERKIYWIVTSNSLAYMTADYHVTTIQEFPYPNNYDLYENSKGDIWVISSAGIYVIPAEELLANGTIRPVFYGVSGGLPYTATANSFSELTADGDLYIASTAGVVLVNIETPFENISDLKIALPYMDADGERIYPDSGGNYVLPGNIRKLTVYPYVFNYLLIDPKVSFRLEGFDSEDVTVNRSALMPVDYTNLRNGEYYFVLRVEDPVGHVDKTVSFQIVKGTERTAGSTGSIIMDIASLFFMVGLLIYTSLSRKRGRLDDRLFLAMILTNMVFAFVDGITYLMENSTAPFTREIMIAGNMLFFTAFTVFPYISMLYLDYRAYHDRIRIKRMKLLYGIPCAALIILLFINLKTGWIFRIGKDSTYYSGSLNNLVFIPVAFYWLISMCRVAKISLRLVLLSTLLILVRISLGIWIRDISSSAFIYTLFLVCMHLYGMNRPMNEEAP